MSLRVEAYVIGGDGELKASYQLFGNNELPQDFVDWLRDRGCEIDEESPSVGLGFFGEEEGSDPFPVDPTELCLFMEEHCQREYEAYASSGRDPFALPYDSLSFGDRICALYNECRFLEFPRFMRFMEEHRLVRRLAGKVLPHPGCEHSVAIKAF